MDFMHGWCTGPNIDYYMWYWMGSECWGYYQGLCLFHAVEVTWEYSGMADGNMDHDRTPSKGLHNGCPRWRMHALDCWTFSRIIQCQTRHVHIGEYYQHFILSEDKNCWCQNMLQTREHVLFHCKTHKKHRYHLGTGRKHSIEALLGPKRGIRRLARFIKASRAYDKEDTPKYKRELSQLQCERVVWGCWVVLVKLQLPTFILHKHPAITTVTRKSTPLHNIEQDPYLSHPL